MYDGCSPADRGGKEDMALTIDTGRYDRLLAEN